LLGHLPQKGEKVVYEDVEFNIEAAFKYGDLSNSGYEKNVKKG